MLLFFSLIETEEQRLLMVDLYYKYRSDLLKYANKFLNNKSDAEDTVHDVFCAIADTCVNALISKSNEEHRRFMYVCTRNRAINYAKSRERVNLVSELPASDEICSGDDMLDSICDKDMLKRAKCAISGFKPIYGDALWLYFSGFSVAQIATLFGEKPETIKKRLFRGKKMLRAAVGVEGGEQ